MGIPVQELEYICKLLRIRFESGSNVYVFNECSQQIQNFEKRYKVSFINDYMFIEGGEENAKAAK